LYNIKQFPDIFKQINQKLTILRYNTTGWVGLEMVNTNYHKSINKALISRNYFDGLQKRLLLGDNHPDRPGFAIGILKDFGKCITNAWTFGWPSTKLPTVQLRLCKAVHCNRNQGTNLRIVIGTTIIGNS
jgi:hypothetical protein